VNRVQLKDFRNRLLQELAAVTEAVRRGRSDAEEAELVSISPDETDIASLNHNRSIINTVTGAQAHRKKSIEQAIQRIDRGDYGSCRRCDEEIHVKRLMAIPWATLCLQCQAELENAGSAHRSYDLARFDPEDSDDVVSA
jgi:DnaK suppressor protein